jgi:hypothetical protein
LIERGHDLGGLVWAAPAKDPGYTAELLLDDMNWRARRPQTHGRVAAFPGWRQGLGAGR